MSVHLARLPALAGVVALVLGLAVGAAAPARAAGTDTWTGMGDDSSWSDGANWGGHVPVAGDSVVIRPPSKNLCHAHVTGAPSGLALASFTLSDTMPATGFTCLASVSGGSLSVAGTFTFTGGEIDTAITLLAGSTGRIAPGPFADDSEFGADLTVHSTLTLDGNVDDPAADDNAVELAAGAALTIASDGTLDADDSNDVEGASCCTDPPRLINQGTLDIAGGQLRVYAAEVDQDARLDTSSSGQLRTTEAPDTAGDGASYTGDGSWLNYTASSTALTGTQTLGAAFTLLLGGNGAGGDENLTGTFTLAGTGTLGWDGGRIGAAMTISHGVRVVAAGNAPAGDDDARTLDGTDAHLVVTNHGAITFSGGADYYGTSGATISNGSDGTISFAPGTSAAADCCLAPQAAIANHGGVVTVPTASPAGSVELNDIAYRDYSGTTSIAAGQTLSLVGGATNTLSTDTVGGGGRLQLASPTSARTTVTVAASSTLQLLDYPGTVDGTATIGGAGRFLWTGGAVSGAITVATTGGAGISGTATKNIVGTTDDAPSSLRFTATTTVAAGTHQAPDEIDSTDQSTLTFAGATNIGADVTFGHGSVVNTGTLLLNATAGHPVYVSAGGVTNRGALNVLAGTLQTDNDYAQAGGITYVAAGATLAVLGSSSLLRVSGGTLGGSGRVTGSVSNTGGQVAPGTSVGSGTLTVSGDYMQGTGGSQAYDERPGSEDHLSVGGSAYLHGSLIVNDIGFSPSAKSVRTPVLAASITALPTCSATIGYGYLKRHWVPSVSGGDLVIHSVDGQRSSC